MQIETKPGNFFLAALPEDDYQRLFPHLTEQPLARGHVLQRRDQALRLLFFPNQSLCWLTNPTEDGSNAQAAMVGREGFVGVEAVLGSSVAMCDAIVHGAGDHIGHTLSIDVFRREFDRRGALYELARQYAGTVIEGLTRWAACNAWHSAEERCCRWLLEAELRLGQPELSVTHELLSDLLGLRRSTVTQILRRLHAGGIISTHRGLVQLTNHEQLEQRSCACYKPVRTLLDRSGQSELPSPVRAQRRVEVAAY